MKEPNVGVYICQCGLNIADKVNIEEMVEFAKTLPHVTVAREYKFMCSDPGQQLIQQDIREGLIDRVVVAACTPLMHEATFRRATEKGGANPFLFQQANIREHVSWVTGDGGLATEKAKALLAAAVRRVALHEPLERKRVAVNPNVLVVGAGIAGIQAALVLADAGRKVYLLEREPSIGGHMAMFDKTFPTLDCSACILTPKMVQVGQHPNIELLTYSEVEDVSGYVGNFKVQVRKKARYINEELCNGCGVCIEKCPWKNVPSEFDQGLGTRPVVYMPFPQAVPRLPVIDREHCVYFTRDGKCKACQIFCPLDAIDFEQQDQILELEVGNVVLATGYKTFDARRIPEYGYGRLPNVLTGLEFERMLNTAGPTGGKVVLRDGYAPEATQRRGRAAKEPLEEGRTPESVAIIHCVGSRDENFNAYCSAVCCMYSLKFAHLVKERTGADVYNFYIDIRASGKGYEEFYHRLLKEGVKFIRGKVISVSDRALSPEEEGKIIVTAEDTLLNSMVRVPVDMVILSVAMEPQADVDEVRRQFGISCSQGGFFLERHPKLAPVSTLSDGIYLAGACQGPKDIPDSVAQGQGAAGEALALIDKGFMELEPNTAYIDEEFCSGCRVCVGLCPYNALEFSEERKVAVLNEALCKGCGVCVAGCPSGALHQHLFDDEQILEEIQGVLTYA